jgi:hypothetical protein
MSEKSDKVPTPETTGPASADHVPEPLTGAPPTLEAAHPGAPEVDARPVEGPPGGNRPGDVPPGDTRGRRPVTRGDLLPALSAIGFIILLIGLAVVWLNPSVPPQVRDADQRIASLDARLRQLEARPVPPPAASPGDVARLGARVDALEARQNADPAQVAQRLDVMAGRIEGLTARLQTGQDDTKQAIDAVSARVARLEGAQDNAAAIQARVAKVARLQDAAMALNAGKPLGDLTGAPPALTKYAATPPPTEAQLRLAFPAAQRAALAAEQPDPTQAPFADRVWEKAQALVTVRRGNEVVVGNQSAVALEVAKTALDAGDLGKAVAALSQLADAPKKAMAGWLADAQSLLAARAALASMAGQA